MYKATKKLTFTLGALALGGLYGFNHYQSTIVKLEGLEDMLKIKRKTFDSINNIDETFKEIGFSVWNHKSTIQDEKYFNDAVAYQIDPNGLKEIIDASFQLHNMCLEAVDDVVNSDDLMELFEIPPEIRPEIRDSWNKHQADLLGRFDFAYDGLNPPKLLEYNADTPTLLLESSEAQAIWASKNDKSKKQFNYLNQAIKIAMKKILQNETEIVFAGIRSHAEEWDQLQYLEKLAKEIGKKTELKEINELQYQFDKFGYHDLYLNWKDVRVVSKLYPWEWIIRENLGTMFEEEIRPEVRFLEPAWKMILSNKAILSYLWYKYPNHPNLLASYTSDPIFFDDFQSDRDSKERNWVIKPKLGRGGDNIEKSEDFLFNLTFDMRAKEQVEIYDSEGNLVGNKGNNIIQEYYSTPSYEQRKVTIGSWIVNGFPAGICVREDTKDIIKDDSPFISHYVEKIGSYEEKEKIRFDLSCINQKQKEIRKNLYGNDERKQGKSLYECKKQEYDWQDFDYEDKPASSTSHRSGGGGGGHWGFWSAYNSNPDNNNKVNDIKKKASTSTIRRGQTSSLKNLRARFKVATGHISRISGGRG